MGREVGEGRGGEGRGEGRDDGYTYCNSSPSRLRRAIALARYRSR